MGEIKKQGISNSIIIMFGAVIGALNVMFLFPKILPEAYFGLTRVLVELTYVFLQFGLVGANGTIVQFWNRVKSGESLFKYILKYTLISSVIVLIILLLFKAQIVNYYIDKSPLISEYYNSIFILFTAGLVFELFSAASSGMLKTQMPTFLKEVLIRIYVTIIIIIYYYQFISENTFIRLFILGYIIIGVLIFLYYLKEKADTKNDSLTQVEKKEISKYRVASFFNGFSGGVVNRLDIIMIAALISNDIILNNGLKSVAIYSIALSTATLIEIPSRGVFTISTPVISKYWAMNEIESIRSVYQKSSINLLVIALLLFLLLSLNIDSLLSFIKESFLAAKPVILILGISKVFNMLLGLNNIILATSKHYLIGTYTMIGLIGLTFGLNLWLIPLYGINGAAIGSLISLAVFNLTSYFFLWYKFNIQPFSINTLKAFVIAGIAFYVTNFIQLENVYLSIFIKSVVFSTLYLVPVYFFKVSEDINDVVNKLVRKFFKAS